MHRMNVLSRHRNHRTLNQIQSLASSDPDQNTFEQFPTNFTLTGNSYRLCPALLINEDFFMTFLEFFKEERGFEQAIDGRLIACIKSCIDNKKYLTRFVRREKPP